MLNLYLITNTIDGTMYVGKTSRTVDVRWLEHLRSAKRGSSHLHRAIRKHGANNFTVEPLILLEQDLEKEFTDENSLNDGEKLMIRLLRVNCRLYNLTDGGDENA